MKDEDKETIKDFNKAVNMTASEISDWLETDESKEVGDKGEDDKGESIGHRSGRRIIKILEKNKGEYTDDDIEHMQKVVGYIHRHRAQKPDGDITDTNWRYSLMNWGNDPKKGDE